jgi:sec-independent protein translocase protein TatB
MLKHPERSCQRRSGRGPTGEPWDLFANIQFCMFGTLGGPELILIFVVGLIVFGPRKLPEIGKSLGKMIGEFKRASADFQRTVEDEVESEKLRGEVATADFNSSPPADVMAEKPVPLIRGAEGSIPSTSATSNSADLSGDSFSGDAERTQP